MEYIILASISAVLLYVSRFWLPFGIFGFLGFISIVAIWFERRDYSKPTNQAFAVSVLPLVAASICLSGRIQKFISSPSWDRAWEILFSKPAISCAAIYWAFAYLFTKFKLDDESRAASEIERNLKAKLKSGKN